MDPITLALTFLLKNPSFAASAVQSTSGPGKIDVAKMQGNLVDLSKGILTCYHKSAKFHQTDIVKNPWERQGQYGAENSMVVKISYSGMTMTPYYMFVAVMAKGNSVRTAIIQDSAIIPYNKKCALEDWAAPE